MAVPLLPQPKVPQGGGTLLPRILLAASRVVGLGAACYHTRLLVIALWPVFGWDSLAGGTSFLFASICFVFRDKLNLKKHRTFFGLFLVRVLLTFLHVVDATGGGHSGVKSLANTHLKSLEEDVYAIVVYFTMLYLLDHVTEVLQEAIAKPLPHWHGPTAEIDQLAFGIVHPIYIYFRPKQLNTRLAVFCDLHGHLGEVGLQFGTLPMTPVRGKNALQFDAVTGDYVLKVSNLDQKHKLVLGTFRFVEVTN